MKICTLILAVWLVQPVSAQIRLQRATADLLFQQYDTLQTSGISVLVIKNGKKIYDRSFGLSNIETREKTSSLSNYRIASVTKSFTAMAIMMLRDDDRLSLSDSLTKYFPETAPYGNTVTIRQLLNHTAGLPNYGNLLPPNQQEPLSDLDVLNILERQDSTLFPPGSRFDYSNSAYVMLGLIIEKASGLPYAEFLQKRIFQPLQMEHTTVNNRSGNIANRAYGYSLADGKPIPKDQSIFSYLQGDGGIYSSTHDFYNWDQALYTEKLITAGTMKETFTESARRSNAVAYGYGWEIEQRFGLERIFHAGGTSGFSSYYVRYPARKFSIIVFANQSTGIDLSGYVDALEKIFLKDAR